MAADGADPLINSHIQHDNVVCSLMAGFSISRIPLTRVFVINFLFSPSLVKSD